MIERSPVEVPFRGRQVLTNPPPSSGGILISYALDLLERSGEPLPLDDPNGPRAARRGDGRAQRARTPEFHRELHEEGFAERFLSGAHIEDARARIVRSTSAHDRVRASADDRIGSTTHISVLDGEGNAASVTCSNGSGSGWSRPARASTSTTCSARRTSIRSASTATNQARAHEHDGANGRASGR